MLCLTAFLFFAACSGLFEADIPIRDPEIMLFLIIELVSSTCYSAILYKEPVNLTHVAFLNTRLD